MYAHTTVYEDFATALSGPPMLYDGAFQKRPRGGSHDGCGIFWRRSKFRKLAESGFVYDDRTPGRVRQDRCGLLVLLQSVHQPSQKLIVLSTHLARNPVSAAQTRPSSSCILLLIAGGSQPDQVSFGTVGAASEPSVRIRIQERRT